MVSAMVSDYQYGFCDGVDEAPVVASGERRVSAQGRAARSGFEDIVSTHENAKFVLGLIDVGFDMEPERMANILGLRVSYVERQLRHQSLRAFVKEHMVLRQKNLAEQE